MISKPQISIVIPTYNRTNYIEKILYKLVLSTISNEIIICDGGSKLAFKNKIKKIIKKYYYHKIKYIDIGTNNHSAKRNKGILSAQAKYIVLLDDDCIPEKRFLEKYISILDQYKNKKIIFCGSVLYPKTLMKKNFIKFRQSRHFIIKNKNKKLNFSLHPRNIVTMNMAFKKKLLEDEKIFFYEKFNIYGFEDYEFAFRLKEKNYKIAPCNPKVFHNDERSFKKYLDKIKFVGYEGGNYLIKLNKKASLENNYIRIQDHLFTRMIKKMQFILHILIYVEKKFIILEKKIPFPNLFYRVMSANAYLIGHLMSNSKKNDNSFTGWYK
tara:strand:- start:1771 stop:2745 length:975 start_codon:yes stop_codon:yes gene_type:complete